MIPQYRKQGIKGIALGLFLSGLFALFIASGEFGMPDEIVVLGGILAGASGITLTLRGCLALAQAKGHSGCVMVGAIYVSAGCGFLGILVGLTHRRYTTAELTAVLSLLGSFTLLLPIVMALALEDRNKPLTGRRKRGRRFGSNLERIARYRRNALLGIYFGLGGIVLGVCLVIFHVGIFRDHANEVVLAAVIFLCGYCAVIEGCRYWLKAKGWNEQIVFIALMPLAVLLVPYVRLVFLAVPALLPVSMVMMPLILIVVVMVLQDKSRASRRKPWWGGRPTRRRPHDPAGSTTNVGSNSPLEPIGGAGGSQSEKVSPSGPPPVPHQPMPQKPT